MGAAKDGLQAGTSELQQQLTAIRSVASDELAQMRDEFRDSLNGFFGQQQQQLESSLSQQRSGLEVSVNKLRSAFDHEAERRVVMHSQWMTRLASCWKHRNRGRAGEQVNLSQAQALLSALQRRDAQLSEEVGKESQALQQVRASLQAVAAQLDELTGQLPLAASQYFDAARQSAGVSSSNWMARPTRLSSAPSATLPTTWRCHQCRQTTGGIATGAGHHPATPVAGATG